MVETSVCLSLRRIINFQLSRHTYQLSVFKDNELLAVLKLACLYRNVLSTVFSLEKLPGKVITSLVLSLCALLVQHLPITSQVEGKPAELTGIAWQSVFTQTHNNFIGSYVVHSTLLC